MPTRLGLRGLRHTGCGAQLTGPAAPLGGGVARMRARARPKHGTPPRRNTPTPPQHSQFAGFCLPHFPRRSPPPPTGLPSPLDRSPPRRRGPNATFFWARALGPTPRRHSSASDPPPRTVVDGLDRLCRSQHFPPRHRALAAPHRPLPRRLYLNLARAPSRSAADRSAREVVSCLVPPPPPTPPLCNPPAAAAAASDASIGLRLPFQRAERARARGGRPPRPWARPASLR